MDIFSFVFISAIFIIKFSIYLFQFFIFQCYIFMVYFAYSKLSLIWSNLRGGGETVQGKR
jgi:hypothetical protein